MEHWPTSKINSEFGQLSLSNSSSQSTKTSSIISNWTGTNDVVEVPQYCSTNTPTKARLMQEINIGREGEKRITEKYDSVDKLRSCAARDKLGIEYRVGRMSDGSSDISDPHPSSSSTASNNSNTVDTLSEQDFLQVEMFFRSHKTDVHVCQCLANLYFASGNDNESGKQNWEFASTGIPLLILDTGEHHRKRRLQFSMAEKGTGFVLFKDVVDHLTKYSAPHSNFHTLHVSTDHKKLAGLSFDDTAAATEFLGVFKMLTSNPDDDLLNLSKKKKKDKNKPKVKKYKAPKKAEISQPCCFLHVTKLERPTMTEFLEDSDNRLDKESLGSADTLDELSS